MQESLVFTNAYANGWRSTQAVASVLASIPALMEEPLMYSNYQNNKIDGLGTLLKSMGYTTSFFHGADNGWFKFDWFSKAAGFDNFYGRTEFNNDNEYDHAYGIYDEPFFQFFANKMDMTKEPFCSVFFSLSSHHPYKIPLKYKNKFPKGNDPIIETIGYADYSLKQFFLSASKKKWFKNTLFIITADHTHVQIGNYDSKKNDFFAIPILFYKKDSKLKGQVNYPIQQIDILPSILDYLNYNGKYVSFGKSVFDSTQTRYAFQYLNGIYQILDNQYLLIFNGNNTIGFYDYHIGKEIKDLKNTQKDKLENQLKAVIQTYHNSLIDNKIHIN
jgi:phosphoglycerol transferase MdoB-like AlkP superfamily enzyme